MASFSLVSQGLALFSNESSSPLFARKERPTSLVALTQNVLAILRESHPLTHRPLMFESQNVLAILREPLTHRPSWLFVREPQMS